MILFGRPYPYPFIIETLMGTKKKEEVMDDQRAESRMLDGRNG